MAISLKTINASIQEGNEDTRRLSSNFESWFESQKKSRLDDLEDRREKRKQLAGATGGGHQKFKNRNGMGAGLLGLGAGLALSNRNSNGDGDGDVEKKAGAIERVMTNTLKTVLALSVLSTVKKVFTKNNSIVKARKNFLRINTVGMPPKPSTGIRTPSMFGGLTSAQIQALNINNKSFTTWKPGNNGKLFDGTKIQFNAKGTHYAKLDGAGKPTGAKIRVSSKAAQIAIFGPGGADAFDARNAKRINASKVVPIPNLSNGPPGTGTRSIITNVPTTKRLSSFGKFKKSFGVRAAAFGAVGLARLATDPRILAFIYGLGIQPTADATMGGFERDITAVYFKALAKGPTLKNAIIATKKFLKSMLQGDPTSDETALALVTLLAPLNKPDDQAFTGLKERKFIEFYSYIYSMLNKGQTVKLSEKKGGGLVQLTPDRMLTSSMLNSGFRSPMDTQTFRDAQIVSRGVPKGTSAFSGNFFPGNEQTGFKGIKLPLPFLERFPSSGFQAGTELSPFDALNLGPDLTRIKYQQMHLKRKALEENRNANGQSSSVNMPVIDQSRVDNQTVNFLGGTESILIVNDPNLELRST